MAKKVGAEGLAAALEAILEKYKDKVVENTDNIVKEVARNGQKALQQETTAAGIGHGKYAAGWKMQGDTSGFYFSAILYNDRPGLPHLLEHPHMLRNGKRSKARVHIAPVEKQINEFLEKELRRKL